jgi:hypothetical protein
MYVYLIFLSSLIITSVDNHIYICQEVGTIYHIGAMDSQTMVI